MFTRITTKDSNGWFRTTVDVRGSYKSTNPILATRGAVLAAHCLLSQALLQNDERFFDILCAGLQPEEYEKVFGTATESGDSNAMRGQSDGGTE